MTPRALYSVPPLGPDDDQTVGEQLLHVAGEQQQDRAEDVDATGPLDDETAGEYPDDVDEDHDQADEEEADDESQHRAFAWPDLRPYADPKAALHLAVLGAGLTRRPARALGRLLLRLPRLSWCVIAVVACIVWTGTRVLSHLLLGWLTGTYGKKGGSFIARSGIVAAGLFCAWRTVGVYQRNGAAWLLMVWLLAAVVAERWNAEQEDDDEEPKSTAKKGKAKKTKRAKDPDKSGAQDTPVTLTKGPAPSTPTPAVDEPDEDGGDVPDEPPLTALIRTLIGDLNGVHLQTLRPAMRKHLPGLAQATDVELRQHLISAGFDPSRKFRAGGVAGRAGVHRGDLPPLPSPEGGPGPLSDPLSGSGDAGQGPDSPRAESGGEGGGEAQPTAYDWEPDPESGPAAWRIRHHK